MNTDKLGNAVYVNIGGKIEHGMIIGIRESIRLNMGSDRHGRFMPKTTQYLVRPDSSSITDAYVNDSKVVFNKEEIHKII